MRSAHVRWWGRGAPMQLAPQEALASVQEAGGGKDEGEDDGQAGKGRDERKRGDSLCDTAFGYWVSRLRMEKRQ